MILFVVFISVYSQSNFTHPPFEASLRILSTKSSDLIKVPNNLLAITQASNSISLYEISSNLSNISEVLKIAGNNIYEPIKTFTNSSELFILTSVNVKSLPEIPELTYNQSSDINGEQAVLFKIVYSNYTVIESDLLGSCFTGQTYPLDGFYYSSSLLFLLKDTCSPDKIMLQSLGVTSVYLSFTGDTARVLIMDSFLYVLISSSKIDVYKYDLYLKLQWKITLPACCLLDYFIDDPNLIVLTTNQLFKISDSGDLLLQSSIFSFNFSRMYYFSDNLYATAQLSANQWALLWISSEFNIMSTRNYENVTFFSSVLPGSGLFFYFFLSSTSSFYSDYYNSSLSSSLILQSIQPFETQSCDPACNSCFANDSNSCYSCKFFETGQSPYSCGVCDPTCSSCFGSLPSQCISCTAGFIFYQNSCYKNLTCTPGQFQSFLQESCIPCDNSCSACTGPSFTDCLNCAKGFLIDHSTCMKKCLPGKYSDGVSCKFCDAGCLSCSGPGSFNCTSCNNGQFLYEGTCFQECPNRTYPNAQQCFDCSKNCSICDNQGCVICDNQFFLHEEICGQCPNGCEVCNSSTFCYQCGEGLDLNNISLCMANCSDGYFSNNLSCTSCDASCKNCYGGSSNECSACNEGNLLLGSTCQNKSNGCPDSFYESNGKCLNCGENCKSCNKTSCFLCNFGYSLLQNSCLDCNTIQCNCSNDCLNCISGICYECPSPLYISKSLCVSSCDLGDFVFNNTCYCKENCLNCINESCIQCLDGFFLNNNSCALCSENCAKCKNQSTCDQCLEGFYWLNEKCADKCPMNYSAVGTDCIACADYCKSCTEIGCNECVEDFGRNGYYQLINGTCGEFACFDGFNFDINEQMCVKSKQDFQVSNFLDALVALIRIF